MAKSEEQKKDMAKENATQTPPAPQAEEKKVTLEQKPVEATTTHKVFKPKQHKSVIQLQPVATT